MNSILDSIPFEIDIDAVAKKIHLLESPEENPDDWNALREMIAQFRTLGRPKAVWREIAIADSRDGTVSTADGVVFRSVTLSQMLKRGARAWCFCATCGTEVEPLEAGLDVFRQYWFEELKMILLAAANRALKTAIREVAGPGELTGMAPGSGDAGIWDISELRQVFAALGNRVEPDIGARLTDSMLMLPNKSCAGIMFHGDASFESCRLCHREKCPNRRAPFDHELWSNTAHRTQGVCGAR